MTRIYLALLTLGATLAALIAVSLVGVVHTAQRPALCATTHQEIA